jgi:hypothetical protein
MRSAGHVARIRKIIVYSLLVGKPKGKRPLRRPRRRWVDNNRMDFAELGWSGLDWIGLAQVRDKWTAPVNVVMNLRISENDRKLSSAYTTGGLSSSA